MGPMQNRDVWYNEPVREGREFYERGGPPLGSPTNYAGARRHAPPRGEYLNALPELTSKLHDLPEMGLQHTESAYYFLRYASVIASFAMTIANRSARADRQTRDR
jgi:hypothetical protein